jgi:protein gp37
VKDSAIEWTDHTFNPWIGCTKVSPGCANCYAETLMDTRMGRVRWGKGNPRQRTSAAYWRQPLTWNSQAALFMQCRAGCRWQAKHVDQEGFCPVCGDPESSSARPRVFCASLADWLDDEVPIEWLADLLDLIRRTPNLDWLLLTKRPQNWDLRVGDACSWMSPLGPYAETKKWLYRWLGGLERENHVPPANVWIGTSVEDQARAKQRIPSLLRIPARVRFLSMEPLLGPVDLVEACGGAAISSRLDWLIVGGESGPNARPMHPNWARSIRDQCKAAGVAFFFKQWGEHDHRTIRMGKKLAGRLLDGVEHNEFPR